MATAGQHDGAGRSGRRGSGDGTDVGGLAPGEQEAHGPSLARRLERSEDVGQQPGGRRENLGAQLVKGSEHLAVLGQLGLATEAGLDVAAKVEVGDIQAVDDAG